MDGGLNLRDSDGRREMIYAAIVFALLLGIAGGAAFTWWRMRTLLDRKPSAPVGARRVTSRTDNEEIRRYQMANNAMGKLIEAERFDEAFTIARNWCNRAPDYAEANIKLKGQFEPAHLPPVEYAAQHLVALRNVGELRRLRDIMMGHEALKRWQDLLTEEIVAANELHRIFDVVEDNPGIPQETAVRRVGASLRRAIKALHDADLRDLIRRERAGQTYALYLE